ncbi:hypothetical protein KKG48_01575 [Patescibacteria group bacterium]|nr:hypothetical protein [Patescibacteria group bacterium]MCG2695265.1 hypothetical protein [Candidatus Parcubacteria bacterium]
MEIEIQKIIEDFLNKLSVDFEEVTSQTRDGNGFCFVIKSKDSGLLIGADGNNLKALNHIIKQIVRKNDRDIKFFVDVNDYHKNNIEKLKEKAIETAGKAIVFKRDIEMEPMSSFERMIIHSALSDNPEIKTESAGEGVFRKVVIKYTENAL